jgi:hypothetical protein
MSYPYRMNLSKVKIQQLVTEANAVLDSDFRQARAHEVFQPAVLIVPAQINLPSFKQVSASRSGNRETSAGYLVIKQRWLDKNSITLKVGDKIIGMATSKTTYRDVQFRLTELLPQGHLPYPALLLAMFLYDTEERTTPS